MFRHGLAEGEHVVVAKRVLGVVVHDGDEDDVAFDVAARGVDSVEAGAVRIEVFFPADGTVGESQFPAGVWATSSLLLPLLDEIMTSLNRASGRQVQIYDIDRSGLAEMAERSDPLVERLREEAIPITGTPIATLIRAAA